MKNIGRVLDLRLSSPSERYRHRVEHAVYIGIKARVRLAQGEHFDEVVGGLDCAAKHFLQHVVAAKRHIPLAKNATRQLLL